MTIPEEIEELKTKLGQTTDEREQAEILLDLLNKYNSINSTASEPYTDRLLQLAEKLKEPVYKGWGLFFLASSKQFRGEHDTSINSSQQAIALFEQAGEKMGIAACLSNNGMVYYRQGNYAEALKNHFAALKLRQETGDKRSIADTYNHIGVVYYHQGNYPRALKNHFAALKLHEETGDKLGISNSYNNIGNVYLRQGNYPEALKYHQAALKLNEETGDKRGIGKSYNNTGTVYEKQGNFPEALKNYFAALKLKEEIGDKRSIAGTYSNIGMVYQQQGKYPEALKNHFAALKLFEETGEKQGIAVSHLNIGDVHGLQANYGGAQNEQLQALTIAGETGAKDLIQAASLSLARTFRATGDFENAYTYYEKYHETDKDIRGDEATKQLNNLHFTHQLEQKENEVEINRLKNVELKNALDSLQVMHDRSEELLLNILPAEVAAELKETGGSEPRHFDEVTVMFTDFQNFTAFSEKLSAGKLVGELNTCFSAFDDIIAKYNIEKIKTMGDGFIAASGLPTPNASHAADMVRAAIEIRDFMTERKKQMGDGTLDVRIGLHSGRVVAGIVGVKKFAYDIWGDTVNTAARMEQNGTPGQVNISQTTYELVKDKFTCTCRGEIEAKNKGKLKMYFVE